MANWGYGLSQGAAAAASGVVDIANSQLKQDADDRAANRELDVKLRIMAAQESLTQRAEDRKRQQALQQGQTINAGATGLLNSAAAANMKTAEGDKPQFDNPSDPAQAAVIASIRANPDTASAYGLQPEDEITQVKARANAARNVGDLAAAKELDIQAANLRKERADESKGKRDERRMDILQEFQQKQADRQNTLAEATLAHQKRMESSADTRATESSAREQRAATAKALDGVNADIRALEKEAADPLQPEKAAVARKQLDSARAESAGYRRALAQGGLAIPDAPAPALEKPTPASDAMVVKDPSLAQNYIKRFGQAEYDRATKKAAPAVAPKAGMLPASQTAPVEAPYVPPPESPAGMLAARNAATRQGQEQQWQQRLSEAQAAATKALQSKDPADAQAAQDAAGFAMLSQAIKSQIFALVRGR